MRNFTSSSRWQGIFEALGFGRRAAREGPIAEVSLAWPRATGRAALLTVLYWDPQQSAGANLGGSGSWTNGGAAVWYNPATQTDVVWNNTNGDAAVFQGSAAR